MKLYADSVEETTAFVGNLASGATGNVDVMVTGASATMDDGTINVDISYEDNAGNVTTETRSITLYVSEEFFDEYVPDDAMGDMGMGEGEMEESSHKGRIIAIIVVVLLVAAGAGVFAVVRLRNKKKEANLLADDLASIDENKD